MAVRVTVEQLQTLYPTTKKETLTKYIDALNATMDKYGISENSKRVCAFIAQVGHESGGFVYAAENLNYSADGLQKIFKKYFPDKTLAEQYARQPQKIASRVYASRMGNGNEASTDGWKYRGRGLIQITGKDNYTKLAGDMKKPLDEVTTYLETVQGACDSAGWYWSSRKLNALADKEDTVAITKAINGGTIGLEDRQKHYAAALKIIK